MCELLRERHIFLNLAECFGNSIAKWIPMSCCNRHHVKKLRVVVCSVQIYATRMWWFLSHLVSHIFSENSSLNHEIAMTVMWMKRTKMPLSNLVFLHLQLVLKYLIIWQFIYSQIGKQLLPGRIVQTQISHARIARTIVDVAGIKLNICSKYKQTGCVIILAQFLPPIGMLNAFSVYEYLWHSYI